MARKWLEEIPRDEWCIVRYTHRDGSTHALIRLKYQWEAQRLKGKWEYAADGLTHKQAMEFKKLFEGA